MASDAHDTIVRSACWSSWGVGDNAAPLRAAVTEGLSFLDIAIDRAGNETNVSDGDISAADATIRTAVVDAREDLKIARLVRTTLGHDT